MSRVVIARGSPRAPARAFRPASEAASQEERAAIVSPEIMLSQLCSIWRDPRASTWPATEPVAALEPPALRRAGPLSLVLHAALLAVVVLQGDRLWKRTLAPGAPSLFLLQGAAAVAEATAWHILPCLRRPGPRHNPDRRSRHRRLLPKWSHRRWRRPRFRSRSPPQPVDTLPAVATADTGAGGRRPDRAGCGPVQAAAVVERGRESVPARAKGGAPGRVAGEA